MLRAAYDLSDGDWTLIAVLVGILAVATMIGAVVLWLKVWKTRKMLGDLGAGGKVAFYGALIYTIFPVDLLPDPVYLDDMGVLTAALIYLTRLYHKRRDERRQVTGPTDPSGPSGPVDRSGPTGRSRQAGTR